MQLQIGVKVIIKNSADEYLFIRRTKLLQNDTAPSWDIPGGRIDPHEPLHTALKREVKEELGVDLVADPELLTAQDIFVDRKDLHVVRLTYIAEQNINAVSLSDEHDAYKWATIKDSRSLSLEPFLAKTIAELTQ